MRRENPIPILIKLAVSAALVLSFLLTGALAQVLAQTPDPIAGQLTTLSRQQLDAVKVLIAQEKAWNRGDLDAFAEGYKNSPDTLFIGRQISRGYAEMLSDYKHNYPNRDAMGTLSFTDLEAHALDEHFTVLLGKYHLDRSKKAGGNADGLFSLVLEKTDRGWKIVVDHTT